MKASDPQAAIQTLLTSTSASSPEQGARSIVKTCGMTSETDISQSLQAGAGLIGLIFAQKSPRAVRSVEQAKKLVEVVRRYGERTTQLDLLGSAPADVRVGESQAASWYQAMGEVLRKTTLRKPLTVGVFQNQPLEEVNEWIRDAGLDLAQLHGQEDLAYMKQVQVPCIKVLHMAPTDVGGGAADSRALGLEQLKAAALEYAGTAVALLLDSKMPGAEGGGTGKVFDWTMARDLHDLTGGMQVLLAGGLTPDNVGQARGTEGVLGVDVSSGIEVSPGVKDVPMMQLFIRNTLAD